jgi:hypothetical protein
MSTRVFNVCGQCVGIQVIPTTAPRQRPPASVTYLHTDVQHANQEAELRV